MTERHHIGWRSEKTAADKSKALGEHEKVVYRTWDREELKPDDSLGDEFENLIAARINSQRGIVIHRLTKELPWTTWYVDLRTTFGSEQAAMDEAKRKTSETELWSAFRWPA
jgi:hypothetical protein